MKATYSWEEVKLIARWSFDYGKNDGRKDVFEDKLQEYKKNERKKK